MSLAIDTAVRVTSAILGGAIVLSSSELLAQYKRLEDRDLLGWDVGRYNTKWMMKGPLGKIAEFIFDAKRFRILVILRLATGIMMAAIALWRPLGGWILSIAFIETFLIAIRSAFGLDGAYQMNLVALAGLWIHAVSPAGSLAASAGLWFITVQLSLSYVIAGLTKLVSAEWRNGSAVIGIIGTRIYGDEALFDLIKTRHAVALMMAWSVMIFETSFGPLCLFGGKVTAVAMLMGVLFHLSNAVFMGLNGFLISFLAVYPIAWTLLS